MSNFDYREPTRFTISTIANQNQPAMNALILPRVLQLSSFLLLFLVSCEKDNQPDETIREIQVLNGTAGPTDMSFANSNVGYISCGFDFDAGVAVIAKTVDGGANWQKIPVYVGSTPTTIIRNVFAKSVDTVYATYHSYVDYGVCVSKDGGGTWSKLGYFTANAAYSGLFFKDTREGFVCGSGDIYQTKDGGNTWNTVFDYDGLDGVGLLFFTSNRVGYAYGCFIGDHGSFGVIVKTTDGGDSWAELPSMQEAVTCLAFADDNVGYAFTYGDNIYKTADGGDSWTLLNNITGIGYSYYSAIVTGKAKYLGTDRYILKTTDDFKTVKMIYQTPGYSPYLSVRAVKPSENTLFFLSSEQSVIKINLNN